jgi:hypothetical protein
VHVELLAQIADVRLEDARVAPEVVLPHVLEELRAAEDTPRVEHEVAQQAILGRGELDRLAGPGDLVGVLVELEVLEHEPVGVRLGEAGAAQDGPDAPTSSSSENGFVT